MSRLSAFCCFLPRAWTGTSGIKYNRGATFGRNVLRMKRISNVAAQRKEMAVDLVEKVSYDHELRFEPVGSKQESKSPHTAW